MHVNNKNLRINDQQKKMELSPSWCIKSRRSSWSLTPLKYASALPSRQPWESGRSASGRRPRNCTAGCPLGSSQWSCLWLPAPLTPTCAWLHGNRCELNTHVQLSETLNVPLHSKIPHLCWYIFLFDAFLFLQNPRALSFHSTDSNIMQFPLWGVREEPERERERGLNS